MHEDSDGNDELPDLDGGHEFGHRAGHFDFHGAQEVVLKAMASIFVHSRGTYGVHVGVDKIVQVNAPTVEAGCDWI